ncbi:MAG: ATP-binding cassette domain-containing protein [Algoriphagus sp.]|nr:ATP-binding cassette domain-containing protein [Algoriphagus sp.]
MIDIRKLEIVLNKFKLDVENIKFLKADKIILAANNNSGKSIFLLGMTGLIKSKVRDIFFHDTHCDKNLWQKYTGVYHDQSSLIPFLTPNEYFNMAGELKGIPKELVVLNTKKYGDYLNFPTKENKYINELSLGTQKKIGLIASLLGDPSIVLWDEPFTNLDDESRLSLALLIERELKNSTVLLTSPNRELPYESFTSQLFIENGIVHKVPFLL